MIILNSSRNEKVMRYSYTKYTINAFCITKIRWFPFLRAICIYIEIEQFFQRSEIMIKCVLTLIYITLYYTKIMAFARLSQFERKTEPARCSRTFLPMKATRARFDNFNAFMLKLVNINYFLNES